MTVISSKINDKWDINLTPDRHEFHAKRPGWEKERVDSCAELMTEGMVIYDLGAESGDFTALYHLFVGPTGTVVPVEPSPPYWPSIRAHWEGNNLPPLRTYFPGFVSDDDGLVPALQDDLYQSIFPDNSGWPVASLGEVIPDFGFRHLAQQAHHTPRLCLDSMVKHLGLIPDAVVMDIEGAELNALRGAHELLASKHPIMWVSVHQPTMKDWYNTTLQELLMFMERLDYTCEKLGEGSEEYWLFR